MRMWDFSSATLFAVEEDSFDIFKGHTSDFSDMFFFFYLSVFYISSSSFFFLNAQAPNDIKVGPFFDDQTWVKGGLDKSSQKPPPFFYPQKRHCQKFFKLEDELHELKPPLHWRFSKVRSPRYKSKSWKAGQRKGEYGPVPFSFKNRVKRERKVWTKGKERHKRRWIIQYAPLVDSFVILYNGPLEKNQLIAWKRSLFLSHHALMLWEKCHNFVSNISGVHVDGL